MSGIDTWTQQAYAAGDDPIDVGISVVYETLEIRDNVADDRNTGICEHHAYGAVDRDSLACRIIGGLLAAGWTPPTKEQQQ